MNKSNSASSGRSTRGHYVPTAAGNRRRRKKTLITIFLLLALLAVIIVGVLVPYILPSASGTHTFYFREGTTVGALRDSLSAHYGEGYADKVLAVTGEREPSQPMKHPGAYEITDGMSALSAGRMFRNGSQKAIVLTVNGFRSVDDLCTRISRRVETDDLAIDAAMRNDEVLKDLGLTEEQRLCMFIEDSYEVYWNTPAGDIDKKFADNYRKVWDKERRAKAEKLGLTPAEVMIICSIVDEETTNADEKGDIGRLYINRLQKNMRLQADPTIRFALNNFSIRRVTHKHLYVDSPYNTYRNDGLPPGPIRTTSVKTIDAVLNSRPHNYLYMCAKDNFSGTHNFAETFDEHEANATRYQKALNQRGIK